jgi:predicted DCC family thiol-disulfide oxidoreductase YuxK
LNRPRALVQRHDAQGRIRLVAEMDPPVLRAEDAAGRTFTGAGAVGRVLRELGGVWGVLGAVYLVAPIGWLADRYYARVARRRAWW